MTNLTETVDNNSNQWSRNYSSISRGSVGLTESRLLHYGRNRIDWIQYVKILSASFECSDERK